MCSKEDVSIVAAHNVSEKSITLRSNPTQMLFFFFFTHKPLQRSWSTPFFCDYETLSLIPEGSSDADAHIFNNRYRSWTGRRMRPLPCCARGGGEGDGCCDGGTMEAEEKYHQTSRSFKAFLAIHVPPIGRFWILRITLASCSLIYLCLISILVGLHTSIYFLIDFHAFWWPNWTHKRH